jgi:Flp pilus assembly protein TadD
MKHALLLAALLTTLSAAQAADTPGSDPNLPATTVADRLANARKAIAAKDWGIAQRELNLALREDPRNADVHNLMGYSWRKRSTPDVTKAFEHYYTALKLDPRHKGAHEYIGEAYLMAKRPVEAEKHLAELEKICGSKTCEEYQELARSIADYKAKN